MDTEATKPKCDYILDEDNEGEFCVIPLGGRGNFFAKIDPEDFPDISQFTWCGWYKAGNSDKPLYAKRKISKAEGKNAGKTEKMHRRILKIPGRVAADHINGDGLDNRRKNLRIANHSQNNQNQKKSANKSSKYKGVCWHKSEGKWKVQIHLNGVEISLGRFNKEIINEVDVGEIRAAKAYDDAAVKYFGSFARLNFPTERNIITLKDGVYKMSYIMSEKDKKKIEKTLKELRPFNSQAIFKILAGKGMGEIVNLCHYLECGVGELVKNIRRVNKATR